MENELPTNSVQPLTRGEWRSWWKPTANSHPVSGWSCIKKTSGKQTYTFDEAMEEVLSFGWIDSKPGKVDQERSMLYFAPRKAGSGWSRVNKDRIERMITAGIMSAAGQAKIDAAKADGTWSKLDVVEELAVPPDLAEALALLPPAAEYFNTFPRSVKRGILEWIGNAKTPATRAKRVDETAWWRKRINAPTSGGNKPVYPYQ